MHERMKIIFLITITCAISVHSVSEDHPNINLPIDELLEELGNYLKTNLLDKAILPDFGVAGAPIFLDVTIRNLSTIYRTSDCDLWTEDDTLKIKMNIGLKEMEVYALQCPITKGPTTLDVKGAMAEIQITLYPFKDKGTCHAAWDNININSLTEMILHSTDKTYDGQIINGEMLNMVISYYNQILNRDNTAVNIHIVSEFVDLCNFPSMIKIYNKYKP